MNSILCFNIWASAQITRAKNKFVTWLTLIGHKYRYVLAFFVVVLSVADLLLTQTILTMVSGKTGTQPSEANVLMAPIIMTWWAWPLRVGIPLLIVVRDLRKNNHWLMFCGVILYSAVVAWNTYMYLLVQKSI
jgi:hypothetical protein